jgi:hypothetical protein
VPVTNGSVEKRINRTQPTSIGICPPCCVDLSLVAKGNMLTIYSQAHVLDLVRGNRFCRGTDFKKKLSRFRMELFTLTYLSVDYQRYAFCDSR